MISEISQSALVILLILSAIFLTLWICFKQSRSQQKEPGASNLAESEKKLTDAEIHIMLLVTPQIFEASYGIKKEQKKRRMHKYCAKYLVKSPSSKEPNPKQPNQKAPTPKLSNQTLPSQKLPSQNVKELNKKPFVRVISCSKIEIDGNLSNQNPKIQNVRETNKKPMVRMTSCSQIEIDSTSL